MYIQMFNSMSDTLSKSLYIRENLTKQNKTHISCLFDALKINHPLIIV